MVYRSLLLAGALLCSPLIITQAQAAEHAHLVSHPSVKTYTNRSAHYTVSYPSSWSLDPSVSTQSLGDGLTAIAPTAMSLATPTQDGGLILVVGKKTYTAIFAQRPEKVKGS